MREPNAVRLTLAAYVQIILRTPFNDPCRNRMKTWVFAWLYSGTPDPEILMPVDLLPVLREDSDAR